MGDILLYGRQICGFHGTLGLIKLALLSESPGPSPEQLPNLSWFPTNILNYDVELFADFSHVENHLTLIKPLIFEFVIYGLHFIGPYLLGEIGEKLFHLMILYLHVLEGLTQYLYVLWSSEAFRFGGDTLYIIP